jgi:N-acetylneuraminate synthase
MHKMSEIEIAGRKIGTAQPPYVIAEMSANHNGDINRAFALMKAAKDAGADAVKLQTYTPDTMTLEHDSEDFKIKGGLWDGFRLYDLYKEAQTPWDWHRVLFQKGRELGITVFSTPFDETAVELLEELEAPAYKIASFEAIDHALIACVARTGKPLIISTGMADMTEISEAVSVAREAGARDIILLHCTSAYPAPAADMHLRTIPDLAETFHVVSGLSDHTLGIAVSVASVALGAAVIEKHFTLKRSDGGHDSAFSLEPDELAQLKRDVQFAWEAKGAINYERKPSEMSNLTFRRSLYVVKDIAEGEELTSMNIRAIRPGFGLPPKHLDQVIGRRAKTRLAKGTALQWDQLI